MLDNMELPLPETLADLGGILDAAMAAGKPHPMDWDHRAMHLRILTAAFGGLDRPLSDLEDLLPERFSDLPQNVRDRIPGNASRTVPIMRARLRRARAVLRPDLYPFDALRAHAERANIHLEKRWYALEADLSNSHIEHPSEIDSRWIAARLANVEQEDEQRQRAVYLPLVRASRLADVRAQGLLRDDLELPPTRAQARRCVVLPDWLQEIHDAGDQRTRNSILRVWRTMQGLELSAENADDILAHIEAGHLTHAAADAFDPISSKTWPTYIRHLRRAMLARVSHREKYATRLKNNTGRKGQAKPRRPKPLKNTAAYRFVAEAIATLQPPVPPEADAILTRETWPRVINAMRDLGTRRGYSGDATRARIDQARKVLGQLATHPVPRLPRSPVSPRPAVEPKPKLPPKPSRVPALPMELCQQAWTLMDLRGYTPNAQRSMIAGLGKAFHSGMTRGELPAEPSLQEVASHGVVNLPPPASGDLERMIEIIRICENEHWRTFLSALRDAGISKCDDPSARLFSEEVAAPAALCRERAWQRELELTPEKRKSFSKAIDKLDALREKPGLLPLLPRERIGPLQSSPLHRGPRHQHARYPLPRTVEADAEALGLAPDGRDWLELMSGLHTIYGAARRSGLFDAEDIGCATLLSMETCEALKRSEALSRETLREACRRTAILRPDEARTTPSGDWRALMTEIRAQGLHRPNATGAPRIPGFYAVRREALADDMGPGEISSGWARETLARIGEDGPFRSTFRQGLRLMNDLRSCTAIQPSLLPPELDDDLLAARTRCARLELRASDNCSSCDDQSKH